MHAFPEQTTPSSANAGEPPGTPTESTSPHAPASGITPQATPSDLETVPLPGTPPPSGADRAEEIVDNESYPKETVLHHSVLKVLTEV